MAKALTTPAGEGVVVTLTVAGHVYTLSDETQARLDHLEAIEVAMRTVDEKLLNFRDGKFPTGLISNDVGLVHMLIRKGIKDNGKPER